MDTMSNSREKHLGPAQESVDRAAGEVKDDPNRPGYHFLPPAFWNNDPNGLLFYNGYYHLFYQHHPYSDAWDSMHWGHARSKDMVFWEHLPIALWPSTEKGEKHCYSGSGYIKNDGKPILFYTSIGHSNPQHWAAIPTDNELLTWEKHPLNPLLVMNDHRGQHIDDWRDPFLFRETDDTYLAIGGHPRGKKGSIMLYKALNIELTQWKFLGMPVSGKERNWECPNFFKIGDRYIAIYSPHRHVKFKSGKLDFEQIHFSTLASGTVDYGSKSCFYAPNTLQMDDGRRVLFGWIRGFKKAQGWNGAISLPRELSMDTQGQLIQNPIEELTKLREKGQHRPNISLKYRSHQVEVNKPQFELKLEMGEGAKNIGLRFNHESGRKYIIKINPKRFKFDKKKVPIDPGRIKKITSLRIFFDRTVIEIFVNGGDACAAKVVYPQEENLSFQIFSTDKQASIKSLDIWEMKSIW